jgi:hypothetical protein
MRHRSLEMTPLFSMRMRLVRLRYSSTDYDPDADDLLTILSAEITFGFGQVTVEDNALIICNPGTNYDYLSDG